MKRTAIVIVMSLAAVALFAGCNEETGAAKGRTEGSAGKAAYAAGGNGGRTAAGGIGATTTEVRTNGEGLNAAQNSGRAVENRLGTGEDFGELQLFEGSVTSRDSEWFLRTEEGEYQLGLGNHDYRDVAGLDLEESESVDVAGVLEDSEISVATIVTDEGEIRLRTDDGVPMWAGQGRRVNDTTEKSGNGGYRNADAATDRTGANAVETGGRYGGGRGAGRASADDAGGTSEGPGRGAAGETGGQRRI